MINNKKYIYVIVFSLILSLSFFLTNLFYKDDYYAKYTISIFDNLVLPKNVQIDISKLDIENYRNQIFDNCERKQYSSELLNFRFRKINSLIHLDFIFIEDNDKLNVEIENCINKSFANYKILIQEYFKGLIESSDMNEQFIKIVSDYLYKMDISPKVIKNIQKNLKNKYSEISSTKNLNDTLNECNIPDHKVWAMPAGDDRESLMESYGPVMNFVRDRGWRYTGRSHIMAFNTERCV